MTVKANSHIPCRVPVVPCRANSNTPCLARAVLRQRRFLRAGPRNEDLHDLNSSRSVITVIKPKWMGEPCGTYRKTTALGGKPERRTHLEDLGLDDRIILKCTLKKLNSSGSGYRKMSGC